MSQSERRNISKHAFCSPVFRRCRPIGSRGALYASLIVLLSLTAAYQAAADTISGTVKDPSGAVVAAARVEITGGTLTQPLVIASDDSGKFIAPNLSAGPYSVRVIKTGFDDNVTKVDLHGTAEIAVDLVLAKEETSITVTSASKGFANSDPTYRKLRDLGLGATYRCENFTMTLDVGTFLLKSGTLTLLEPVNNFVTGAIFVGEGHFTLKPVLSLDTREMMRRAGAPTAEEDFGSVVFRFSPGMYPQFSGTLVTKTDTPKEGVSAFQDWKNSLRRRHEIPQGWTQAFLESETMDNVDADLVAAIDNPQHPPFFNAYMHGSPHKDLRFFIRSRVGAVPQLDSPEEVALINCDGDGMNDGVWYLAHLLSEFKAHTASSSEDRRLFATHHYTIETDVAKNSHLYSRATITFEPLLQGERVMKFGLLPSLRVTRVTDQDGHDLHFVQEDKKQDGSFYAILDEAPPLGKEHSITVEYVGDKVLYDAGGGSYYVGARESWYPNLNGFGEKALYDLTFKVPHPNVVISVGKLQGESTEAGFAVSHWVTPVPVAVAGLNYGLYKKMDYPDTITHYNISGYYLEDLPDTLKPYANSGMLPGAAAAPEMPALSGMNPKAMTNYALDQARAQMQLCTFYFGKSPYDNIDITEQPNFSFGQSWPNLVYLPIAAYIDDTQRWLLFGHIDQQFTGFVREVTPHEVAHQWFGHSVTWASYHDLWLSEGFAEFAAGLFMEQAMGPKWQKDYLDFWERQRQRILAKNNFGNSPNDAGPIWMGLRLSSPRTADAYQGDTYSKGAYVLLMLRSLMYDDQGLDKNKDQRFIDMMHDFITTHHDMPASTESFKAVVEKHMTKQMDLQQNGRMDWFFAEWVYGTQVPRYQFKYDVLPGDKSAFKIRAEITQSEVDNTFAMQIPLFADFGNGMVRLGQVEMVGSSTRTIIFDVDKQPKKVALNYLKDILER
jgi:hypothetical protein